MSTPSDPGPAASGRPDGVAPGPGGEQAPACYRHPGRETYVSCVRCGRYACPDCMRAASVGQQCVDCVGEGARSTRQARTTFGGRPVTGAVVTWTLLAINVAVFLVAWVRPEHRQQPGDARVRLVLAGRPAARARRGGGRVVPADHVRVRGPGRRPERPGVHGHPVQHVGAGVRGTCARGSARPGPLPRGVPAQRRRRFGNVLLPRAADRVSQRVRRAPSSGCSGRGSWCPGGCASTPAASSC